MKRFTFFLFALVISSMLFSEFAIASDTSYYVNSLYYNRRLEILRTSFDRWQNLAQTYYPGKHPSEINSHIYSVLYDFNYGKDTDNRDIYPQLLGAALGWEWVGAYFLLNTTDFANYTRDDKDESRGHYQAATMGVNVDLKYVTVQSDVTFDSKAAVFYAKAYIPFIETYFGFGFNKFKKRNVESNTEIVSSKNYMNDVINARTTILKWVDLGFSYFTLVKANYVPSISTSLHQFVDGSKWDTLGWDIELYFESRIEHSKKFDMKDYEIRLTIFKFFFDPLVNVRNDDGSGICLRATVFLGLSYKSSVDKFNKTIAESGQEYGGQDGFGFEFGIGLRVLGFKEFGFSEDTYVKLSYFYNYSLYFERYIGIQHGLKFRVIF
ncbi:hypothetical protein ACFL20_10750 [Spirochaetota bacterium]